MAIAEVPPLADYPHDWARAPAIVLRETLEAIEQEYGSIEVYMDKELGLDEQWRRQIRLTLVDRA